MLIRVQQAQTEPPKDRCSMQQTEEEEEGEGGGETCTFYFCLKRFVRPNGFRVAVRVVRAPHANACAA